MRIREDNESIFLRYRMGNENRVINNITDVVGDFIKSIETSGEPELKVLHEMIKSISDGMGYGVSIDSTWYKLIEEVYEVFKSQTGLGTFDYSLLNQLLKISIKTETMANKWDEARTYVLEHIDQFSMWDSSYAKMLAEGRNIKRDKDGKYYTMLDGEVCECIGVKTIEEEKFDFIMSTTLGEYGSIFQILRFIALIFISEDFNCNPGSYPKSLNIMLPESDKHCWFSKWQWNLRRHYGYTKSGWRPNINFCDPEWLVSDLLAHYSDSILDIYTDAIYDYPEDYRLTEYQKAFEGFLFQLAYVLDTDLRIGERPEVYFMFRDRSIRWINGTAYTKAIIVIPTNNMHPSQEDKNIVNEFISAIVWKTEIPVRKVFGASAMKRFLPIVSGAKNVGGIIMDARDIDFAGCDVDEREILALALYKEGVNSTSIYYSTLNYYKIIELLFKGKKQDIIQWINDNEEFLTIKGHGKRINEVNGMEESLGNYIYVSCRCAVAHAGQIDNTVSPDNSEDFERINSDLQLIKELAKRIIEDGLLKEK